MNTGNSGSLTSLHYDPCTIALETRESTDPYLYRTYLGAQEHCKKCVDDKFWTPYNSDIVDRESELKGIVRPATRCNNKKYNPKCVKNALCTSTFDSSNPVVFAPEVCPIIHNNIVKPTSNGIRNPQTLPCVEQGSFE